MTAEGSYVTHSSYPVFRDSNQAFQNNRARNSLYYIERVMETKTKRLDFLKRLNIWSAVDKIDAEIGLLEHDFEALTQDVRDCTKALNELPKLPSDGKFVDKSGHKYYDHDIVKLYSKNESGQIIVENQTRKDIKQIPSTLENPSIMMLKAKPRVDEDVFAMEDVGQPWVECKIKAVYHKSNEGRPVTTFKLRRVQDSRIIRVGKFAVARVQNHDTTLRVPKRVIAGPDKDHMLSGIIGQDACKENQNRYMVILDNGSAHYFKPDRIYPILYQSSTPWADFKQLGIHNENLLAELVQFFGAYPRRTVVEARVGQQMEVMRNGVYVPAIIIGMDCDVMKVAYKDRTEESLYRGSPRFIKRCGIASRLLLNDISIDRLFPRLVGNMYRYHEVGRAAIQDEYLYLITGSMGKMNICGQNNARKSTARMAPPRIKVSSNTAEAIFDDRRSMPDLQDLTKTARANHKCSPDCLSQLNMRTEASVTDIIGEFRDVSDLKVPLYLGWRRMLVKSSKSQRNKQISYVYEAPCGKFLTRLCDIRRYLQSVNSKLDIDYFTLDREVDLNRTLGDRLAYYYEQDIAIEPKTNKPLENKNVSLLNMFSEERLPIDFEYSNETFPHPMLKAKGFSFNQDFKSGCDCEDDCMSRVNCACHRLNEEAAGTTARNRGTIDPKCQYKDKRLLEQVSTGIFECNGFCSCSSKCGNRVVQNGIRIRLQVRKTIDKGWGVFVLDDVPKGAFICTYSAELLDDADQYGDSDMYFADLDYITVVEGQKLSLDEEDYRDEGVGMPNDEEDNLDELHPNQSKSKKRQYQRMQETDSESQDESTPEPDAALVSSEYMPQFTAETRYPRRVKSEESKKDAFERSRGFRRIHSILNESQDYTLDARMQGNIGRFFNHSCDPNAFVQNVFIESHDLRFPHVAFFTKRCLKADDEITWHYNYKIDSIQGRQIECNCGASNCAGRIL